MRERIFYAATILIVYAAMGWLTWHCWGIAIEKGNTFLYAVAGFFSFAIIWMASTSMIFNKKYWE